MDKTTNEMTRNELEALATEWKIEFTEEISDEDLCALLNDEKQKAEQTTLEMVENMGRDELVLLGFKLGHQLKGNEVTVRKQLKVILGSDTPDEITKTIEQWANERRMPSWQYAAVKQANKWAGGKMLTEAEFISGCGAIHKPMGS